MTAVGTAGTHAASGSRLVPGFALGDYRLGQPLWSLRIADAYRADGPHGPATIYVIHANLAAHPPVRDQIIAGTRAAAALPEHKHLVKTLAAGLTGDILWIATEEVEGSLVRDMLAKKRASARAGNAGLGTRATGNLITGVAAALGELHHGALGSESVAVNQKGRVRVIDIALGAGTAAAIVAGLIPPQGSIAPEVVAGDPPSGPADVYGVGALLYECLVGAPLERGGPRPSEVVQGASDQIDEIVARACHREPQKRFGRADVLGEVVGEALNKGGAIQTAHVPKIDAGPSLDQQVSLAAEIGAGASAPNLAAASGNAVVDRALATALADTTEKWLVAKGKFDYGPFSLADVIAQIEKGEIVAGNVIMDKDSGARSDVGEHPLLGPMVEAARQRLDDARRAQAEVAVQSREKKRGAMLYAMIALGVLGAAAAVYFIIQAARGDDGEKKIAGIEKVDGASLKVTVTMPKAPPKKARTGGRRSGGGGGGGNYTRGSEDLALDMSDDDDGGSSTLDMGTVYRVYSGHGGKLGGCLHRTGAGSANISIIIDGPSGRVTFVKVDGKQSGGTWACLNGVMRSMKFPTLKSGRTRAEFDIGI